MAYMNEPCPGCGRNMLVGVSERSFEAQIVWFRSWHCEACGFMQEEDGEGSPPESIRQAILNYDGVWVLEIADPAERLTTAIKVLRQALELSLAEAMELRKRIPGRVYLGTRAEMLRLVYCLSAGGVTATVACNTAGPGS